MNSHLQPFCTLCKDCEATSTSQWVQAHWKCKIILEYDFKDVKLGGQSYVNRSNPVQLNLINPAWVNADW